MARVFLSYDREDGAKARAIAQALERAGHFVWYDLHIKGGAEYGREIEAALEKSDAVVVLWSQRSVVSAWVRDEAAAGRDGGCLIPLLIEPVTPPMGFRQYQNLDFSGWKGRGKPPHMAELLDSIAAIGSIASAPAGTAGATATITRAPQAQAMSPLLKWSLIGGAVMLSLLILGPIIGMLSGGKSKDETTTVAITAADQEANPLARDLLVNLARLQSAKSGSIRLVASSDSSGPEPDFIFESAGDHDPDRVGASLILKDGKDKSVLWSKDFDQPSGKLADLKQQIGYTAARVLQCALEGVASKVRLKPQTIKLYLTGCAQIAEVANTDPTPVISTMEQVVAASPKFRPAWQTLLLAQGSITGNSFNEAENKPSVEKLSRFISRARKVDPNMAEATLAETWLLAADDYRKAIELIEKAYRQSPDNPDVLNAASYQVRRVGMMREAVDDARFAAERDPLSPFTINNYISALFYAGRFDSAREELAKAEQLWPGTDSVKEVSFRFNLRYGDPKEALKYVQSEGMEAGMVQFLRARIDRNPGDLAALRATINKSIRNRGAQGLSYFIQTAGEFGWEDDIFALLLTWPKGRDLAAVSDIYFRPQMKRFRSDPRFMIVAKRAGLVGYWQKSGKWPDFCLEPDLPYDCKAEAAKLG